MFDSQTVIEDVLFSLEFSLNMWRLLLSFTVSLSIVLPLKPISNPSNNKTPLQLYYIFNKKKHSIPSEGGGSKPAGPYIN